MIGKTVPEELKEHLTSLRSAMGKGLLSAFLGAGFSFNAEKTDKSAEFISWQKLSTKVEAALCKLRNEPEPEPKPEPFDADSALIAAEEYKELAASLGATSLDDLIYENCSYDNFEPGLLHCKLLSLHWSDIYTTNYDRLFERTQEDDRLREFPVIHRPYNIILRGSSLPMSKPTGTRRIIKLHGSFPNVKPFLLAKDDYDAYPKTNRLFVQEVQRALVNETFCLIGFSGTDPNFRSWVEWVGEELAGTQPKMYLISFEAPDPKELSYYAAHNIVHTNIAPLAGFLKCDSNEDRQSALHIFLDHLKVEYPEEPLWSYKDAKVPLVHFSEAVSVSIFCDAAAVLRAKRESYPGWVFPPLEVVQNAEHFFVFRGIPSFPRLLGEAEYASDRLVQWLIAYEYLWAYDTFCLPLENLLEYNGIDGLQQLLDAVWPLQFDSALDAKLKELPESVATDRGAFIHSLQNAACILINQYRRYGFEEGVTHLNNELHESLVVSPNADVEHWSKYNAILWCLENCDPAGAELLISNWCLDDGVLFWKTRKANLLAESGKTEESKTLLWNSLFEIRAQIRCDGETAYLLSCEAWTERFLEVVNEQLVSKKSSTFNLDDSDKKPAENDILSRTPVLRRLAFHPFQILKGLGDRLRVLATMQCMGEPELEFVSGKKLSNHTLMSGLRPGVHDVHIFFGLLEKTGLPPRVDYPASGGRLSPAMWVHAATVLFRVNRNHHAFIFPLVHRLLEPDVFNKDQVLFSRYTLTNLDQERASRAFDLAISLLSQLNTESGSDNNLRRRNGRYMRFLLQYMGRLSALMDDARRARLMADMHRWYAQESFFYNRDTAAVFLEAFTLAVKSAPMGALKRVLPSLMLLPLIPRITKNLLWHGDFTPVWWPGVLAGRDLKVMDVNWDDVALRFLEDMKGQESWLESLPPALDVDPANAVSEEIGALVNNYLLKQQVENEKQRINLLLQPYWVALTWLQEEDLLTDKSLSKITEHLWTGFAGTTPEMTGFRSFASCVYFPNSDQAQCFTAHQKRLFANLRKPGAHDPVVLLNELGDSLDMSKRYPLPSEDLETLLTMLRNARIPGPSRDSLMGRHDDPSLSCIMRLLQTWGLSGLKRSVQPGQDGQHGDLSSWLDQLKESAIEYGYSTARLDILRLEFDPDKSHDLAEAFRAQLFTGPMREETGRAVLYWKYYFSVVVPFPEKFDDMVADCFQSLAPQEGMQLLRVLHEQLDEYKARFSERETVAITRGLRTLLSALRYDIPYSERFPGDYPALKPFPLEVPYQREQVARFLKSLLASDSSWSNNATICEWIESVRQDPLVDIRSVLS